MSLNFPVERFEIGVWIYPRWFLGSIDNKRSNNNDNGADNQYGEPNSVATCRDLAGRDEAVQKKLLSDRRKRGVLIFDEYGETAQMVDTATGTGIHSSVAVCYQKIRKENGAVYTIIQNPDQLPENEHTKNIIANTDMLFVLPTKEVIYQSVIDRFRLTHPGQIALMKSMRNNFSGQRPYSECFMRLGEHYATVTRLEFSREKFLAFQTEGEIWSDLEEKNRRMSMEDAIEEYIREHHSLKERFALEWKIYALAFGFILIADNIGQIKIPVGKGMFILFPIFYAIILGVLSGPQVLKIVDNRHVKAASKLVVVATAAARLQKLVSIVFYETQHLLT